MRRIVLFAVPLCLVFVPSSYAQQITPAPAQTSSPSPGTTSANVPTSNLTPRQSAEMRGDICMARKEYTEAAAAYEAILVTEPKNAQLLNKTGVAYQQLGDLHKSEHYYRKAMKADKTFSSPINNLGTLEYEKKRYGKAIVLYKKAVVLRTDMATIYGNLGYAYFANKEYPEAMDTFAKALALDPTLFERRSGAGSVIQQRTATDPGLFYFLVAKTWAARGDAEHAAHYLKLARDDGYKDFESAQTDPAFAKVIKDPRVQEVLLVMPSYESDAKRSEPPPQN